jgi:hypothetical protein
MSESDLEWFAARPHRALRLRKAVAVLEFTGTVPPHATAMCFVDRKTGRAAAFLATAAFVPIDNDLSLSSPFADLTALFMRAPTRWGARAAA